MLVRDLRYQLGLRIKLLKIFHSAQDSLTNIQLHGSPLFGLYCTSAGPFFNLFIYFLLVFIFILAMHNRSQPYFAEAWSRSQTFGSGSYTFGLTFKSLGHKIFEPEFIEN